MRGNPSQEVLAWEFSGAGGVVRRQPIAPAFVVNDPDARALTAGDVVDAIRAANLHVAAGAINQPPAEAEGAFQISVQTLGRLTDVEQFGDIVIRPEANGLGCVRVRDVVRTELGSQDNTISA